MLMGLRVITKSMAMRRNDLIDRIGDYCSYCEIPIPSGPDVEHVQPKKHHTDLICSWDNFLLACSNCNSIKGNKDVDLSRYYWPDQHNTFLAFAYQKDLPPVLVSSLSTRRKARAQRAIRLTGLDRLPGHPRFSASDRRWKKRHEVWELAERYRAKLELAVRALQDTQELRESIVHIAVPRGFWSVWMTVFKNDADMLNRFINAFPGTSTDCFDANGVPIERPGNSI